MLYFVCIWICMLVIDIVCRTIHCNANIIDYSPLYRASQYCDPGFLLLRFTERKRPSLQDQHLVSFGKKILLFPQNDDLWKTKSASYYNNYIDICILIGLERSATVVEPGTVREYPQVFDAGWQSLDARRCAAKQVRQFCVRWMCVCFFSREAPRIVYLFMCSDANLGSISFSLHALPFVFFFLSPCPPPPPQCGRKVRSELQIKWWEFHAVYGHCNIWLTIEIVGS